jgi:two-component system phosphate regulon response regulator PhoB
MAANILIVEDEEPLTTLLRYNLEAEGYEVDAVSRGDDADTRLRETAPDLIVLDWMLPGLSGIELCRRLRTRPQTQALPIIMLTARGEESERIRGLATGADDYIVKPFSVPELLARIRALLRRASPERVAMVLNIGDLELDREKKRVSRSARPVDLGPTEFRLLEFLMERPGRTSISTSAPSTSMSAACARRSTAATPSIRSAPCAAPAIRWMIVSAKRVDYRSGRLSRRRSVAG